MWKAAAAVLFFFQVCLAAPPVNQGILPGEPDPTGRHEPGGIGSPEKKAEACKKGQQRFPILECVDPGAKPKHDPGCMNYAPVLICNDKPLKRTCKKPKVAMPVTRCLIRNPHAKTR